ncbi:MAG: hypothetical protein PHQ94_05680 [Syntrophomonas sp.]|nr:hypothetical protein [Syntrophomonas sp.]
MKAIMTRRSIRQYTSQTVKLTKCQGYSFPAEGAHIAASSSVWTCSSLRAAIPQDRPDISPAEFRVEFFRRWYWEDFDSRIREKLLEAAYRAQNDRGFCGSRCRLQYLLMTSLNMSTRSLF